VGLHFDWESLTDSVHRCRLQFLDVTVGLVQGRTAVMLIDTPNYRTPRHTCGVDPQAF
jgi:hypothetical protein